MPRCRICSTNVCRKAPGWAFTTGSVISLLLGVQAVSGVVLAMYYVPVTGVGLRQRALPDARPADGWMVRGLHVWGASFLVVATGVHLLRVFLFAGYKAPREMTWLTGLAAFLVILAFR